MADIYLAVSETPTVVTLTSAVINSAVASSVTVMNTVTVALDANSLSALENVTVTVGAAITGTVTVGNSLTVSSLPAISGTVTANVPNIQVCTQGVFAQTSAIQTAIGVINTNNNSQVLAVWGSEVVEEEGISAFVQVRNQISGTVTIGSALPAGTNRIGVVTIGAGTVTIGAGTAQIGSVTASISSFATSVTARLINPAGTAVTYAEVGTAGSPSIDVLSIQGVTSGTAIAISGTVTANSSNGSLTTRFGSVTTANTAFATSAVTNSNRKYLLIQNVTTASNVITVGIGFTPTTTQGIQLSSGAGLTFEGSYIPTGAVNLLSSVTASCFTILEA